MVLRFAGVSSSFWEPWAGGSPSATKRPRDVGSFRMTSKILVLSAPSSLRGFEESERVLRKHL